VNKEITDKDWERLWAPHDELTYKKVIEYVEPDDIVLEIGAGDYHFARRIAAKSRLVYGLEVNPALVAQARSGPITNNLAIIPGDAYDYPFPRDITLAVLLMRHCCRFGSLADKLIDIGCSRLITNARWGMAVELVDLSVPRVPVKEVTLGWYACWCGAVGFVEGPARFLSPEIEAEVIEVRDCPICVTVKAVGSLDRTQALTNSQACHN
jgi:hypothetical protein